MGGTMMYLLSRREEESKEIVEILQSVAVRIESDWLVG
jgi:hypothetical protein